MREPVGLLRHTVVFSVWPPGGHACLHPPGEIVSPADRSPFHSEITAGLDG